MIDNAIKKELIIPKISLIEAPKSPQNAYIGGSITKGTPLLNAIGHYSPHQHAVSPLIGNKFTNIHAANMLDQAFNISRKDIEMKSEHLRNNLLQQSSISGTHASDYNVLSALLSNQQNAESSRSTIEHELKKELSKRYDYLIIYQF